MPFCQIKVANSGYNTPSRQKVGVVRRQKAKKPFPIGASEPQKSGNFQLVVEPLDFEGKEGVARREQRS